MANVHDDDQETLLQPWIRSADRRTWVALTEANQLLTVSHGPYGWTATVDEAPGLWDVDTARSEPLPSRQIAQDWCERKARKA